MNVFSTLWMICEVLKFKRLENEVEKYRNRIHI